MNPYDFAARRIRPGAWMITGASCDCYLVEGDREAIMIDAGRSKANLRAFAQSLTGKPLRRVINTHSHFDHTGGNGWFEQALMPQEAAPSARTAMEVGVDPAELDYPIAFVQDGQEIDLGGRVLRIIELGCHSPGSIAVLDNAQKLLFCGDEVDSGQVLLLPGYAERKGQIHSVPAGAVEACLGSMQRLMREGAFFDALCTGHNGSPLDPVYLEWFAALCQQILDGKPGDPDCTSRSYRKGDSHYPYANAGYLRASLQGASLIYNQHLLRESHKANADKLPPATPLHVMCAAEVFQKF